MKKLTTLLLIFIFPLYACSNGGGEPDLAKKASPSPSIAQAISTECTDPRPQICTREFMPVCATRDSGVRCVTTPCPSTERKTYPNACEACADPDVYSYEPEACAS